MKRNWDKKKRPCHSDGVFLYNTNKKKKSPR